MNRYIPPGDYPPPRPPPTDPDPAAPPRAASHSPPAARAGGSQAYSPPASGSDLPDDCESRVSVPHAAQKNRLVARAAATRLADDAADALLAQTLNADGTPKRPMNAFMIFARKRRPELAAENAAMRTGEISKILSKEWNAMGSVSGPLPCRRARAPPR